jgi:hypothetical protein
MMKLIVVLAAVLTTTAALAQDRGAYRGPFKGVDAQAMIDVWPEIREAAAWDDIDWRAAGLNHAPGDAEAQRIMATHWEELRRAEYFERIEWDEVIKSERGRRAKRTDRGNDDSYSAVETGPFARDEAAIISRLWPRIRDAESYEDIDWRTLGAREPGDREARRIMTSHWGRLRQATRFEDIDWNATVASRR